MTVTVPSQHSALLELIIKAVQQLSRFQSCIPVDAMMKPNEYIVLNRPVVPPINIHTKTLKGPWQREGEQSTDVKISDFSSISSSRHTLQIKPAGRGHLRIQEGAQVVHNKRLRTRDSRMTQQSYDLGLYFTKDDKPGLTMRSNRLQDNWRPSTRQTNWVI